MTAPPHPVPTSSPFPTSRTSRIDHTDRAAIEAIDLDAAAEASGDAAEQRFSLP